MRKRSAQRNRKDTTPSQNEPDKPTTHSNSEGADGPGHIKWASGLKKGDKRSQPSHHHTRRRHNERLAHSQRKAKSDKYAGSEYSGSESTASKPSALEQFAMYLWSPRKLPKKHPRTQSKGTAASRRAKTGKTTEESGTTKTSGTSEESEGTKTSRTARTSGKARTSGTSRSRTTGAKVNVATTPRAVRQKTRRETVDARTESSTGTGGTDKAHTTKRGIAQERKTPKHTERNRHRDKQSDQDAEVTDLEKLGESAVWRGNHSKLGVVAFKRIKASDPREKKEAENELRRSKEVSGHPNIIQFHLNFNRTMDSTPYVVLIFQYASGGDLKERIEGKILSEDNKKVVMRGSLKGLKHLHGMNLVHGNVMPPNILLMNARDKDIAEKDVKLANFRLTERMPKDKSVDKVNSLCIDEHYMPPEGLDNNLSYALDVWALGVTCYEMYNELKSFPIIKPHQRDKRPKDEVARAILRIKEVWNKPGWSNYEQAMSLCQQMLDTNFTSRISVENALNHPWLKE